MKKIGKRIMCLFLLCIVGIASMAIPVCAAGAIDTEKDVSLTVSYQSDGMAIAGAKFEIYRVADVDAYAQRTLTERFAKYPIRLEGQDQSGWEDLATTLKGYVWMDSLEADFSGETNASGNMTAVVKPGLYLLVGYRRTVGEYTYSASPSLVFLPGSNLEQNIWKYDVTAYPKSMSEQNPDEDPESRLISRKVLKLWDDSGKESKRPQEVTVHLLCDGALYDSVTLNEDNNWRYAWDNLEYNHDWLVTEDSVSGYTQKILQEGITFTVTNTVETSTPKDPIQSSDKSLPKTGLLWWPVLVLVAGGLLFILIGLLLRKGKSRE